MPDNTKDIKNPGKTAIELLTEELLAEKKAREQLEERLDSVVDMNRALLGNVTDTNKPMIDKDEEHERLHKKLMKGLNINV